MEKSVFLSLIFLIILSSCKNEEDKKDSVREEEKTEEVMSPSIQELDNFIEKKEDNTLHLIEEDLEFSQEGFEDKKYYELLMETHLCDPNYNDSSFQSTPCSAKLFKFFEYNHKRKIEDAFLLQVKAGVNNYPYRRLLVFVREEGKLVMMNGMVGYLVRRLPQENGIDDLIVAVIDDLGNNHFDRYDILLRYQNGKYHFQEAIGDLQGIFDTPELKERASEAIYQRIMEKKLVF